MAGVFNFSTSAPAPAEVSTQLNSDKPKIELPGSGRLLSDFAVDLAEVVKAHGIYERGGLAFVVNDRRDGLALVSAQMLRTLVEHHLVCFRVKRATDCDVALKRTMNASDAEGVLAAQQFLSRLPTVERIATAQLPVMRTNGVIELLPPGYDADSLTLTLPQCDYDGTLSLPAAKGVLDDLLCEFPFADKERSKAVAISAMMSLYASGLLPLGALRPMFIYVANAEGAGKTILAKCAISPEHGFVKTDGDLKDKIETTKELLAAVMEARSYILFDNCKKHLESPALEAFVTAVIWRGRILGESKSFSGHNHVTVFVTGNGCTVSPDIRRRSLFVELFMQDERAEDRSFRRVLDETTLLAMRPQILAALWALVREWDKAGRPKPSRGHSSFPQWADVVAGIVEFAGYGCPLQSAEIQSAADIDGADMRELVNLCGIEPMKFDEVVALARERGLFERLIGSGGDDLKANEKSTFGKLLARYDGRIFAGSKRFVVEGKGHSRRFKVILEN